ADADLLDRQVLSELGDDGKHRLGRRGDVAEEQDDSGTERGVANGPVSQVRILVPDGLRGKAGRPIAELTVVHGVGTIGSVSRMAPGTLGSGSPGPWLFGGCPPPPPAPSSPGRRSPARGR